MDENGEIIIYQAQDGSSKIDVKVQGETVWLTQQQMAELYQTSRTNVVEHIQHIYDEGELEKSWYVPGFGESDGSAFGALFNVTIDI